MKGRRVLTHGYSNLTHRFAKQLTIFRHPTQGTNQIPAGQYAIAHHAEIGFGNPGSAFNQNRVIGELLQQQPVYIALQ